MKTTSLFIHIALMGSFLAAADLAPLRTVDYVDLQRYLGVWYEIATIPSRFQKDCTAVVATYTLRDDGKIAVENYCRKHTLDGPEKRARGVAWVTDKKSNAKLRVRFFWPFSGAYWIIDLAPDYSYAVVGHPGRDYLWILSRTRQMDPVLYQELVRRCGAQGYDVSRLKLTPQPLDKN